jgi:hypothetical protein
LVGSARRSAPRADPGDVPRYDLGAGRRQELAARPPATNRLDWRTALVLLTLHRGSPFADRILVVSRVCITCVLYGFLYGLAFLAFLQFQ